MHTFITFYQWLMYATILGITAACVIVPFLKDAHDEARREKHRSPRRPVTEIPTLRPIPNPRPQTLNPTAP